MIDSFKQLEEKTCNAPENWLPCDEYDKGLCKFAWYCSYQTKKQTNEILQHNIINYNIVSNFPIIAVKL